MAIIREGDDALLYLDKERTYQVKVEAGREFHTHRGYIRLEELIGLQWGSSIESSLGVGFYALRPLVRDRVLKTDRRTQVLYPKDIGYILYQLGINCGDDMAPW